MGNELKTIKSYEDIVPIIRKELKQYIINNNLKSLVLGISGGIDSTVCAVLARPVCDELDIPLIGRSLPMSNKDEENELAKLVGNAFCTDFEIIDCWPALVGILKNLDSSGMFNYTDTEYKSTESNMDRKIRHGNIRARVRMIKLYDLAQFHNGLVLSTDNLTEYLLGFWTLHGDVGDYGMIQNLWKTEVYELARWLIENDLTKDGKYCDNYANKFDAIAASIEATPTDGLGITNSDMDQIGASNYFEVDEILKFILSMDIDTKKTVNYIAPWDISKILIRYKKSQFKRNNPINISRKLFIKK